MKKKFYLRFAIPVFLCGMVSCASHVEQVDTRFEPIHERPQFNFHRRGWIPYGSQETYHELVTEALRFYAEGNEELSLCLLPREARIGVLNSGIPHCLTDRWSDSVTKQAPDPNPAITGDPTVVGRINISLQREHSIDIELLQARYDPPPSDQYPPHASYVDGMAFACIRWEESITKYDTGWSHRGVQWPLEKGCKRKEPGWLTVTSAR